MFNYSTTLLPVIIIVSACGGGSGGTPGGGGGELIIDLPAQISWTEPQQNSDSSDLTDLESYRLYYGADPTTLAPITALDLPASALNPELGSTVNYVFTLSDISIITAFASANSTHFFALTAINSLGIESELSSVAQYIP